MHSHNNMLSFLLTRKKHIATNQLESLSNKLMLEWQAMLYPYILGDCHIKHTLQHPDNNHLIYRITLGPQKVHLNIMISEKAAAIIIQLFFGKRNSTQPITKLENVAIIKALDGFIAAIQNTFSILLHQEISASYHKIHDNDIEQKFSFTITSSEKSGSITIAITEELADLIKKQIKPLNVKKIDNIDAITLDLCAVLAKREMTIPDLQNLEVGQMINFYNDDVTLLANEVTICQGKIGSVGEGRAIKVQKMMEAC